MILDENSYSRILDNLYDGLYFTDRERKIRYWNQAAERISGYMATEVVGKPCSDSILTHVDGEGNNLCRGMCPLAMAMADGKVREAEVLLHHKAGHRVPVSVRVSPLIDASGIVIGGVELFTDISHYKSVELRVKELEALALIDHLTKLANRSCSEKDLHMCFAEHQRFGVPFGVLFMDIDHFKSVNDTYGHDLGDRVLRFVADTLTQNSRPFDVVGRWGGEEFIVIARNVTRQQLEHLGDRLRVLVASSYIPLEGDSLHVSISIGATRVRDDDSLDSLLKRADTLLYNSKAAGRNRLTIG